MEVVKPFLLFFNVDKGFSELYPSCERVSQCSASGWDGGQSDGDVSGC